MWDTLGTPDDSTAWPNLTIFQAFFLAPFPTSLGAKNREPDFMGKPAGAKGRTVVGFASPSPPQVDVVLPTAGQPSASAAVKRTRQIWTPGTATPHTISSGTASSCRGLGFRTFRVRSPSMPQIWGQGGSWPARAVPIDRSRSQERLTRDQRLVARTPRRRGASWLSPWWAGACVVLPQ